MKKKKRATILSPGLAVVFTVFLMIDVARAFDQMEITILGFLPGNLSEIQGPQDINKFGQIVYGNDPFDFYYLSAVPGVAFQLTPDEGERGDLVWFRDGNDDGIDDLLISLNDRAGGFRPLKLAQGINESGRVVGVFDQQFPAPPICGDKILFGRRAFMSQGGVASDLGEMLIDSPGLCVLLPSFATATNNRGQIVGDTAPNATSSKSAF